MIQIDWKNASAEVIGREHGITLEEMATTLSKVDKAHRAVLLQWQGGQLGYANLPFRTDYRDMVMNLVQKYRGSISDLVILGIGGSALGNIALQMALNPLNYNMMSDRRRSGPRLFVIDNIDPCLLGEVLLLLGRRINKTLFNVISKSGRTAETAALFMIVRSILYKRLGKRFAEHIVAITDPEKGVLREMAAADGYDTLPIPPDVGGRFSVLSPVGLFSAAMCGIDIDALLAGAAEMANRIKTSPVEKNPACTLAAIKFLMLIEKGKDIQVMMPYSNHLLGLADWYRQLWAESLGKSTKRDGNANQIAPTPIKALGATDQHSQIQLYREGPNDKLIIFLQVNKHPHDERLPDIDIPALDYLKRVRLSKLLEVEKVATAYALAQSSRPSITIHFDAITPENVGAFIFLYEYTTSLMGELLDIDAYNQPAVELAKHATIAVLGGSADKQLAGRIKQFASLDERYLI